MITLNHKKFAETEKEFVESLFSSTGTCTGYAKRYKRKIMLYNAQHVIIGAITRHSVLASATPKAGGVWYSYGTIAEIGEYPLSAQQADIKKLATGFDWNAQNKLIACYK